MQKKTVGIIAEYNPFHNGHLYQVNKAKERWPEHEIVVIMSGEFVQRGEQAIYSFEERKSAAMKAGVNKVIKIPTSVSTQAASIFAEGSVKIANEEGVNILFFGSESNDPQNLMTFARKILENEDKYNTLLKQYLKDGFSFPKSSAKALDSILGFKLKSFPNDILGLEYCKAIVKNNFDMEVACLKRTIDYHSEIAKNDFASATYIRDMIQKGRDVSSWTPMDTKNLKPRFMSDKYSQFQRIIRRTPLDEIRSLRMVTEGMEGLFLNNINAKTYDDFVLSCTSKRYTNSRIKRVVLSIMIEFNLFESI